MASLMDVLNHKNLVCVVKKVPCLEPAPLRCRGRARRELLERRNEEWRLPLPAVLERELHVLDRNGLSVMEFHAFTEHDVDGGVVNRGH